MPGKYFQISTLGSGTKNLSQSISSFTFTRCNVIKASNNRTEEQTQNLMLGLSWGRSTRKTCEHCKDTGSEKTLVCNAVSLTYSLCFKFILTKQSLPPSICLLLPSRLWNSSLQSSNFHLNIVIGYKNLSVDYRLANVRKNLKVKCSHSSFEKQGKEASVSSTETLE